MASGFGTGVGCGKTDELKFIEPLVILGHVPTKFIVTKFH
jgi:hypothetical protein